MKVGQNKGGGRQKNFKDNASFNEKKKPEGEAKKIIDIFYTNWIYSR